MEFLDTSVGQSCITHHLIAKGKTMSRMVIELTRTEQEVLTLLASQTGRSEQEILHEALNRLIQETAKAPGDLRENLIRYPAEVNPLTEEAHALNAAFGAWKEEGVDSIEYQRAIHSEWEKNGGSQ